jgi:hypothetical protein
MYLPIDMINCDRANNTVKRIIAIANVGLAPEQLAL